MEADRTMRSRQIICSLVAGILLIAVNSCSNGVQLSPIPTPGPAEPTPTPRPISIPSDERSHDDRLEWWYYSGHMTGENDEEFGFHFVVFQSINDDGTPAYAAQFSLTDVRADKHFLASRLSAGDSESATAELFGLRVIDWSLEIDSDSHSINAFIDNTVSLQLELDLVPTVKPVLQADIGWFAMPAGWSYYYSWPNMPATGTLTVSGQEYAVSGTGWFDHQWGDFFALGAPGGWQWMGLNLGEGQTLMVTETRNPDGSIAAVFGTLADAAGNSTSLTAEDGISIEVLDTWHSPNTGADYPSRWRLLIESLDLDVEIKPVVADQEVDEGVPEPAIYWEGKVEIDGIFGEERVQQPGYVELTGYVQPSEIPWREPLNR